MLSAHSELLPTISVILPVYNGGIMAAQAAESILTQTFRDFELIIIDDGSVDDTAAIINNIKDDRIRFIRQANRGLAATLNRGIFEFARGRYIARQDHDDLSFPIRFEKQVAALNADPELVMVGSAALIYDDYGPTERRINPPLNNLEIHRGLMFANPFVHTSVMMRREIVMLEKGYAVEPERQPEDFELWSRMLRGRRAANLSEALVVYRERTGSITQTQSFADRVMQFSAENIAYAAGQTTISKEIRDIAAYATQQWASISSLPDIRKMTRVLREAERRINKLETDEKSQGIMEKFISKMQRRVLKLIIKRLFKPELRYRSPNR